MAKRLALLILYTTSLCVTAAPREPHSSDTREQQEINDQYLQQQDALANAAVFFEDELAHQFRTGLDVSATVHFEDNSILMLLGVCEQYGSLPYQLFYEFSGISSTDLGFQPPQRFFGRIRINNSHEVYLTEFLSAFLFDDISGQFLPVYDVDMICDVNSSTDFSSVIILGARGDENGNADGENNSDHENDGNDAGNDIKDSGSGNNETGGVDEDDNTDHENGSGNGANDHINDSEI